MTSFFSCLNPTPSFPAVYTGPFGVGTIDVEVAVAALNSPAPSPDSTISTVSFRIFYPCEPGTDSTKSVYWIPDPQQSYVSAYARFLGASSRISKLIAFFPGLLNHITIPAKRNAKLLASPNVSGRWPVTVFSHGLGGSRNAYSHLLGSLASFGIVAVAPEHRDGSAPISFVRDGTESKSVAIEYRSISHSPSREVEDARDDQLRIRLWELGLVHETLLRIDLADSIQNIASGSTTNKNGVQDGLRMFSSSLDVHRPGSISWSGHSFGAATVYQFVKSVYYHQSEGFPKVYKPLFIPAINSSILRQITPCSTISLLDLWTLPLRSDATKWLWEKPLPCYDHGGPGGDNVLAILSEAFFKWKGNLISTKKAVSASPTSLRRHDPSQTPPHIFYPVKSAHLSQSDFGILFPWATKKIFKVEEPERIMKFNVMAVLAVMRRNGIVVAKDSKIDVDAVQNFTDSTINEDADGRTNERGIGHAVHKIHAHMNGGRKPPEKSPIEGLDLLSPDTSLRGWIAISTEEEVEPGEASNQKTSQDADPNEAIMETEILGSEDNQEQKL